MPSLNFSPVPPHAANTIIAFQGERGANSEIACQAVYPDWQPLPCATFEDAFAALADGSASLAMIPIENSIAGRVADIHHLLPGSGFHIIGEYFLPIHFHLMAPKGASLATLKIVQSHVMGLGQCRKLLKKLKLKAVVAADTAGSAREVAEAGDITRAALAPRLAASVYGLDILAEDVQDEDHNTTRFVILSRERVDAPRAPEVMTSFVFEVRNIPAALYKALGGFATNGVNMTKLESYMVEGHFTATQFFADVEGHADDENLRRAFDELAFYTRKWRVLGTYPAHPYRRQIALAAE